MLLAVAFSGIHVLWAVVAPLVVVIGCQGFNNANATAGALSRHAGHAGSASALMGTFQFSLGASSGVLVGLLTDGTPRGMAAMMFCGMLGAVIADRFRPRPRRASAHDRWHPRLRQNPGRHAVPPDARPATPKPCWAASARCPS